MSLEKFAEDELRRAGLFDPSSDYGGELARAVMTLIKVHAAEGHSGGSNSMAVSLFNKLARYEPITPLTGADDEWMEVGRGMWQNRRCPHVFKSAEKGAYDIQGRVFREPSGSCYTNIESRTPVTFPYEPRTEYVDVPAPEEASGSQQAST